MSVKYSSVPSGDTVIDFFGHEEEEAGGHKYPKFFSSSRSSSMAKYYKSAFTYTNWRPTQFNDDLEMKITEPGFIHKCLSNCIIVFAYIMVLLTFPLSFFWTLKKIKMNERIVIFRLGRLLALRQSGYFILLPGLDKLVRVDVSPHAFSIPPLSILTDDNGGIEVGADVFFSILDPIKYVSSIKDLNHSIRILAQTSLQRYLSKQTLSNIERDKYSIVQQITMELNLTTKLWGVEISKLELSRIKILQEPTGPMGGAANPINVLKSMLFPQSGGASPNFEALGLPGMAQSPSQAQAATPSSSTIFSRMLEQTTSSALNANRVVEQATVAAAPTVTAAEIMELVQPHLTQDLVRNISTVFKFIVTGDHGGDFFLDLKNGSGSTGKGDPPGGIADTTLTLNQDDLQGLFLGQESAFQAYMSGRLQIQGDLQAAMALQDLIAKLTA